MGDNLKFPLEGESQLTTYLLIVYIEVLNQQLY